MAITIDATPGGAAANSYLTLVEADAYLEDSRLSTTDWDGTSDEDKDTALAWATAMLDNVMDWNGSLRTTTQALRWPRSGVSDRDGTWYDYDAIPDILKDATAELAFRLAQGDRTNEPGILGQGMSELTVDVIKIKVDNDETKALVPDYILVMLAPLGSLVDGAGKGGSMREVKLQRT